MRFSDIKGQDAIKEHLSKAVTGQKVSHAYMIQGEQNAGKMTLARAFAANLLCENRTDGDACEECLPCKKVADGNHPDVLYVTHEKNDITVDDIRSQINGTVDIRPYESTYKIYIIDDAERMNIQAQNALLKTLEEPPAYVVILLLATNQDRFLPTILSRCVKLHLVPVEDEIIEKDLIKRYQLADYQARMYASFAQGNYGKAMALAEDPEFAGRKRDLVEFLKNLDKMAVYQMISYADGFGKDKQAMEEYFDLLVLWYRDVLLYKSTLQESRLAFQDESFFIAKQARAYSYGALEKIFSSIETTRRRIRSNVNPQLAMEQLFMIMKEN